MDDPRIGGALDELRQLIGAGYPDTTFSTSLGEDPPGVYLRATLDVDEVDEAIDLFISRLVDLQVDEGLPIHVSLSQPLPRVLAQLERMEGGATRSPGLAAVEG